MERDAASQPAPASSPAPVGHADETLARGGIGIKGKLLAAFGAMALLTAGAGGVAWIAFVGVERSVARITSDSVASMVAAIRLADKSAEITATAPAIIASQDDAERARQEGALAGRLDELAARIEALRSTPLARDSIAGLAGIEEQIGTELAALSRAVERRLELRARREAAVTAIAALHGKAQAALEPPVDDAGFNLILSSENVTEQSKAAISGLVEGGVNHLQALLTLRAEGNEMAGLLTAAANVEDPAQIAPIRERFRASAATAERSLADVANADEAAWLRAVTDPLTALGSGDESLFELRLAELKAVAATRESLQARRAKLAGAVEGAHDALLKALEPMVDDAGFNLILSSEDVTAKGKEAISGLVEGGVNTLQVLLALRADGNLMAGLLAAAANVEDPAQIAPMRERFRAASSSIDRGLASLTDADAVAKLRAAVAPLAALGSGESSLLDARLRELGAPEVNRAPLRARRVELAGAVEVAHDTLLKALGPMVDDAGFNLILAAEEVAAQSKDAISRLVEGGVSTLQALLTLRAEANEMAGLLTAVANVGDPALIGPLRERFRAAAATAARSLDALPVEDDGTAKLRAASAALVAIGSGTEDLFAARLAELKALAETRNSLQARRAELAGKVEGAHDALLKALEPLVDDAGFNLILSSEDVTARSKAAISGLVEGGVSDLQVLLTLRAEGNLMAGLLMAASNVEDPSGLGPVRERFVAAADSAEKLIAQRTAGHDATDLKGIFDQLIAYGRGDGNIFDLRRDELVQQAAAQASLDVNSGLALKLGVAVAGLVAAAQRDTDDAAVLAGWAIGRGKLLLLLISALSALGAVLIVTRYVLPQLIRPIEAITDAMTGLAGGDTEIDVPGRDRQDELGRMAQALGVFRDTAIEVQKSNLREIAEGRRRLAIAIESISEAFSLYDRNDRLVVCNNKYRTLLHPSQMDAIETGMSFETIIRISVERGDVMDAAGREEEWIRERVQRHRNPHGQIIQQHGNGRWILISEQRTDDGGTVALYSDITELKERENELAKKSMMLERLSNQLAKYLAPQVYDSIFTGKQEARVTSARKKLTVFFSDIAGFTETTDRMESEDLTRLLNHYLTEMSEIALAHGATIDKYVGDAIVIFFGDPETRGVKEDALACVEMAIAMQKRMAALQETWRISGVERPLKCRIGINTGFCTVGNFGSENRMDYTIIGGGVNLASRLESAAEPGSILISYETYAHVRDQVKCAEQGTISVKGIAYPVATYKVIDLYDSLDERRRVVRDEWAGMRLELDLDAIAPENRGPAAAALMEAARQLAATDAEETRPRATTDTLAKREAS